MPRRRLVLSLLGAALITGGVLAAGIGILATLFSSCCGSPDPPDGSYAAQGVVVALVLWALAAWALAARRRPSPPQPPPQSGT